MGSTKKTEQKQSVNKDIESEDSMSLTHLLSRKEAVGTKTRVSQNKKSEPESKVKAAPRKEFKKSKNAAEESKCTYTIDSIDSGSSDLPGVTKLLQRKSYLQYVKEKEKAESAPQIKKAPEAKPENVVSLVPAEKPVEQKITLPTPVTPPQSTFSPPTPPVSSPIESAPPAPRAAFPDGRVPPPLPKPVSSRLPSFTIPASPQSESTEAQSSTENVNEPTTPALQIKARVKTGFKQSPAERALMRWNPATLSTSTTPFLKWLHSMVQLGVSSVVYLEPFKDPAAESPAPAFIARAGILSDAMAAKMGGLVFQTDLVRELYKRTAARGWLEFSASSEAQSPAYEIIRKIFSAPADQFMTVVCFPKGNDVGSICVLFSSQSLETKGTRLLQAVTGKKTEEKKAAA